MSATIQIVMNVVCIYLVDAITRIMMDNQYNKMEKDIPDKVSWMVVDAWKAIPPCVGAHPFCHAQCPYYQDCYPEDYDDE